MHTATEWIQLFFFVKYGSRRGCLSIGGSICGDACFSRVIFVCRAGAMLENEGHKSGVGIRVSWVRTRSSNPPYVFSKTECHKIPVREKKGAMISGLRVSDVWFFVRVFLPDCVGTKMKMINTIFLHPCCLLVSRFLLLFWRSVSAVSRPYEEILHQGFRLSSL